MVTRNVVLLSVLFVGIVLGSCSWWSLKSNDLNEQLDIGPLPDFSAFKVVTEKKQTFFNYFSTLSDAVNQEIRADRERLMALRGIEDIGDDDTAWLIALADHYGLNLSEPIGAASLDVLLQRVDELPNSLVLAQAAIESAWGTSRFAKKGRNFFGQWCYSKGCGLVPSARSKTASHEVKVFESPLDSVRAYFDNLNRNAAYKSLRRLRTQARESGQSLSGCRLAEGLKGYSELGAKYIAQVKRVIRTNGLEKSPYCKKPPKQ